MNTPEMRERCAGQLLAAQLQVNQLKAFIGPDGFVCHVLNLIATQRRKE
jgi:hypothetical protein